jgi:hypothetical protein
MSFALQFVPKSFVISDGRVQSWNRSSTAVVHPQTSRIPEHRKWEITSIPSVRWHSDADAEVLFLFLGVVVSPKSMTMMPINIHQFGPGFTSVISLYEPSNIAAG